MKTTLISIHGAFCGIYAWGHGFDSRNVANQCTAYKWESFWKKLQDNKDIVFWRYVPPVPQRSGGAYLVSTAGSLFLHPMDFHATLTVPPGGNLKMQLKELEEICTAAAKACGGTFELTVSKSKDVEFDDAH